MPATWPSDAGRCLAAGEGTHLRPYELLGARLHTVDGVQGTRFAVWAPNASRVSVVGDFNGWDGRAHALQPQGSSGVWCAFVPGVAAGAKYKFDRVPNIDELLGHKYEFKIIKLNKRRRNIVVSRRVILEQERAGKREKLMKELSKDQVRKGVVKNITDFGAFIDLGGVDGLLHITDMSWGRISHPSEMVQIGMELEIKVLDIDWERERISLGLSSSRATRGRTWRPSTRSAPA